MGRIERSRNWRKGIADSMHIKGGLDVPDKLRLHGGIKSYALAERGEAA